ncbi:MAG TPA: mannosyltransferase family protein [Actinomycetota bacterium]|nr:mannosyltransferase family protein [Actinomycetota bacterium]
MSSSLRSAFLYALKVFLVVRFGLFILALLSPGLFPPIDPVSVPGWPARPLPDPGWHNLFTSWERFDALWYLRIADRGYRVGDGSAAFFPLYPLLTRVVSVPFGGHPLAAALLVSNAALLGALTLLYDLTRSEISDAVARTTVVLVCVFPTSFFLFAPYTESLFLLMAVAALWAARRDRWWLAGVAGFGAALTRNVGIVLAVALVAEAIQRRVDGDRGALGALGAAAVSGAGTLAYLVFWQLRADDWLAPIHQQANWERVFSWPWATLVDGTRRAFAYIGAANGPYWLIDWLIVVPLLAASVVALFRYRWTFRVFLWGGLLIPLSYVFADRPLMSMPRFVLPLFPAFWALAELLDRSRVPRWAAAAVGAAGLGLLVPLYVNWYYIF